MLFKRQGDRKPRYPTVSSVWDDEKVQSIASCGWFEINLTSFVEEKGFGRSANGWPIDDTQAGYGFTTGPFNLVAITFADEPFEAHTPPRPPTIGSWMYDVWGNDRKGHIGSLNFTVFDQERTIRAALKQAHAASLISGTGITSLVILKEEGVGVFSAMDREYGYSHDSRFPFCGMRVVDKHQSSHLKKWAVPRLDADFSLDGAPI